MKIQFNYKINAITLAFGSFPLIALYAANDAVPAPINRYGTCSGKSGITSLFMEVSGITPSDINFVDGAADSDELVFFDSDEVDGVDLPFSSDETLEFLSLFLLTRNANPAAATPPNPKVIMRNWDFDFCSESDEELE